MQHFSYYYKGQRFESTAKPTGFEGDLHYRVILPDGREVSISPLGNPSNPDIVWVHASGFNEMNIPIDLIQAMGEALEKAMEESSGS